MNEESQLNHNLAKLEKATAKQTNLTQNFLRGVLTGFGFFVGNAILAAILVYLLAKLPESNPIGHILHNIVDLVSKAKK